MPFTFQPSRDYGSDWASYFEQYTTDLAAWKESETGDDAPTAGGELTVVEEFKPIALDKAPKAIRTHVGFLGDREVSVIVSTLHKAPVLVMHGEKAGQIRYKEKTVKWYQWITTDKKFPFVKATYTDTSLDIARIALENGGSAVVQNVTTLKNLLTLGEENEA